MSLTIDDLRNELEAAGKRRIDPYRTHLQFLIGLIGFCLAVIVGVLAALPKSEGSSFNVTIGGSGASASGASAGLSAAALGGVLAWIAIAALVATFSAFVVQVTRGIRAVRERNQPTPPLVSGFDVAVLWIVAALPIIPGAIAVAYCVRVGASLMSGGAGLQPLQDALKSLF